MMADTGTLADQNVLKRGERSKDMDDQIATGS
jgi:hypothetical protein